eukprot:scaffold819_cov350-Prasinococcus_capsulatus_cf.AAC.10
MLCVCVGGAGGRGEVAAAKRSAQSFFVTVLRLGAGAGVPYGPARQGHRRRRRVRLRRSQEVPHQSSQGGALTPCARVRGSAPTDAPRCTSLPLRSGRALIICACSAIVYRMKTARQRVGGAGAHPRHELERVHVKLERYYAAERLDATLHRGATNK